MPLTTSIKLVLNAILSKSGVDLTTPDDTLSFIKSLTLADGTGTNQADKLWHDQRTLTTGANENLDLAAVLADVFGVTFTLAKIKAIVIKSADANTTELQFKSDATNGVPLFSALGDGIRIPPGGLFVWTGPQAGIAVTAATGDLLNVANAAGASAIYDIIIVGTSA